MKNVNYTLSDNTVIATSPMKNSRTGYLGSSFFEVWRPETPFVASHGNSDEMKELLNGIVPNINTTVHLFGEYNDSREAAYAAAKFREDPITTMIDFLNNGKMLNFPTDLYDLPVYMSLAEAQSQMMKVKKVKKEVEPPPIKITYRNGRPVVKKTKIVITKDKVATNDKLARLVFWEFGWFGESAASVYELLVTKYTKKTVDHALMNLTWNEFDLRFGLEVI